MGQAKHTPGKWTYSGPDVPGKLGTGYVREAGGMPVAKVCTAAWSDAEADANARLIAAAPELLEACKLFLAKCRCVDIHHHGFGRAFDAAVKAVQEVEGE